MRIACHYFEGKTIHPVTPRELTEEASTLIARDSDASSSSETVPDDLHAKDPQKVKSLCFWCMLENTLGLQNKRN
jgi:hypothetical protein